MGLVLSLLLFPLRASIAEPVSDVTGTTSRSDALNRFVLDGALVPPEKIVRGMERDGVRSVDEPRFSDLEAAQRWVAPDTVILGVSVNGDSRAYPEHLLDFHQVINDEVGGVPIVVFWDPIAGLPMAFERKIDDRILIFGVAGLIYQSHCLLYDGETKSVWFPQKGQAIAGPLAGQKLKRISLRKEPLGAWVREHPDTRVLDRPFLDLCDLRRHPNHDARPNPNGAVVRLLDEVGQHLLCNFEVGNNPVLHRFDGDNIAGCTAKHLLGLTSNGLDPSVDLVDGNDRRLVNNDPFATSVNTSVSCAKINGKITRKK